jgi:hypothetical protein
MRPQLGTSHSPFGTTTPLPTPLEPNYQHPTSCTTKHNNKAQTPYSFVCLTCTKSGSGWRGISSSTAKPMRPQLGTNHSPSGTTTPLPTSTPPARNTAPSVVPGAAAFPLPLLRPNPKPNQPLLPRWRLPADPAAARLAGPNPRPKNPSCRANPKPPKPPSVAALLLATLKDPPGPRFPWKDSAAAAADSCC